MDDDELYIDPAGKDCVTARQAARITGRKLQTIYSWDRRGLIAPRMTDDHGRKVYLLDKVWEVADQVRERAERILNRAA